MADRKQMAGNDIRPYVTAGNAIFTVLNPETGGRFTYRIQQKTNEDGQLSPFFVSVLSGNDNEKDYMYIGFIRDTSYQTVAGSPTDGDFVHGGRKAAFPIGAPCVKAFDWTWRHIDNPAPAIIYHEGRCGRCGRPLTVPESIESGLGPVCAKLTLERNS